MRRGIQRSGPEETRMIEPPMALDGFLASDIPGGKSIECRNACNVRYRLAIVDISQF
jgi:hypothetical protein